MASIHEGREFRFYDKPGDEPGDMFTSDEFRLWQCGYRRACVNMLLIVFATFAMGIVFGMEIAP